MREVRIKDTLTGELRPLEGDGEVGIYACGPTVYSRIHIGNARPFVVFSLFARFLRSEGYRPKLVVNVTDINDKIYVAARAAGEASAEVAAGVKSAHFQDTHPRRAGPPRPGAPARGARSRPVPPVAPPRPPRPPPPARGGGPSP